MAVSGFAIKRSEIASVSYFSTKFLNERYEKTIELARAQNQHLNVSSILEEAQAGRFSETKEFYKTAQTANTDFCRPKVRNRGDKETEKPFCTFNKKLLISHLHKNYPGINWKPVEDTYRLKKKGIWLYRSLDWLVQYSSIVIIFWLLPLTALWVLTKVFKTEKAKKVH